MSAAPNLPPVVPAKMWPLKRVCYANGLRAWRVAEVGGRTYLYRVLFVGSRWRTERQSINSVDDHRAFGALVFIAKPMTRSAAEDAIWTDFEKLKTEVN